MVGQTDDMVGQMDDMVGQMDDMVGQMDDMVGQMDDPVPKSKRPVLQAKDRFTPKTPDSFGNLRREPPTVHTSPSQQASQQAEHRGQSGSGAIDHAS
jgi:hypothetical protein